MLTDLHAHTSGISTCCRIPAETVVEEAKNRGIDALVITNHYHKPYITDNDFDGFADRFINEYHYAKVCGQNIGIKIFRGIEVTMEFDRNVHILIYGADEDFIRDNPTMFDYSQKELYGKVKEHGAAMIQAHPFRNGTTVLDTNYLDGIEINCHPIYNNSYSAEILEIAAKNHLIVTCGGDFHGDSYRPKCGILLPDGINNSRALGKYILTTAGIRLCVQEPNTETEKEIFYQV